MTLRFTQIFLLCIARLCYGAVGYAAPQGQSLQDRGNRWLDNATDAAVINLLAEKGQCTYYFDQVYYDLGLESCSIYCPNIYGEFAVDWNCTFSDASLVVSDADLYFDEQGDKWTPGNCSCSVTTQSVSVNTTNFANPDKVVQDLTAWGYRISNNDYQNPYAPEPDWHLWEFELPGASKPLMGIFGVKRDGSLPGLLQIEEVWTRHDKRINKAYLSDQTLSFWKLTPLYRSLSSLHTIRYTTVQETSLQNLTPVIYNKMKKRPGVDDLLIRRAGNTNAEVESFQMLLTGCTFGKAAQRSIDQYAEFNHRQVVGFQFTWDGAGLIFDVLYDGSGVA